MTSAQNFSEALTLCLEGHLIDSLTLAKVIDTIQSLGGDYQLNHLSIGSRKNELSVVILTLLASSVDKLDEILAAIQPYGAKPLSLQDATLLPWQDASVQNVLATPLPSHVRFQGTWIPVQSEGLELVIAVNSDTQTAQVKHRKELQAGEQIVSGFPGVRFLEPPCKS